MKKHIYLCLLAVLMLPSCTNDFFELDPADKVVIDKVFQTADDYNLAVVACYAKLQSQVNFYTECCEYRSDNLYLSAPTSGTQDRYDIDQFAEVPSNGILDDYWANFNNNVYRCNMVLDRIDGASFDESLKKQYKGEALFVRALNYFNMYRVWGGVPVARQVLNVSEALQTRRATDEEMYNYIAGDLKSIIDEIMLPASYSGDDIGRATSGAAMALLGKVYLTFHKWQEAADVLSQLRGKYELLKPVQDVFDVENKMNREIIFAVRFNKEVENEGHGYWFSTTNLTDNTNQSEALVNCYEANDARKALITYVQAANNVCLMPKFMDTRSTTYNVVGNDQILLRYADVLLMYAEALNELHYDASSSSVALECLNDVRTRSGIEALDASDVPDKASFRKAILDERQREFPYEGHRWFDLVRMGYAQEVMGIQDYQLLFPIPQNEMEKIGNTDILWQNPGYEGAN